MIHHEYIIITPFTRILWRIDFIASLDSNPPRDPPRRRLEAPISIIRYTRFPARIVSPIIVDTIHDDVSNFESRFALTRSLVKNTRYLFPRSIRKTVENVRPSALVNRLPGENFAWLGNVEITRARNKFNDEIGFRESLTGDGVSKKSCNATMIHQRGSVDPSKRTHPRGCAGSSSGLAKPASSLLSLIILFSIRLFTA